MPVYILWWWKNGASYTNFRNPWIHETPISVITTILEVAHLRAVRLITEEDLAKLHAAANGNSDDEEKNSLVNKHGKWKMHR